MRTKKKIECQLEPIRYEIETFRHVSPYVTSQLLETEPTCWNGMVSIRKWKITYERMDEPKEVLAERLRKLWRKCDNMHHMGPLRAAAQEIGIELDSRELSKDLKPRN